ncbi:MAG TPA: ABC transporter permease [Stellaceae bacterium]|nr:ABC transporter permease [Stellaceae bacterium]
MSIDKRSWLVAPAVALLAVVFVYPVFWLLLRSFSDPYWGIQNFRTLVDRPLYLRALANTVIVSGSVTLVCLLLGYPLAYTIANAGSRLRRLLVFAVLIPFWTSLLVRTFAWMVLLQQKGLINQALLRLGLIDQPLTLIYNRVGVIIGMVHILLPFMVLPLYSVLTRIDPSYTSAAASLGAPPLSSFLRIYLPLSLPGVLTGTVLVFAIGLGYYITPALLGGPGDTMIAQLIEMQVSELGRWGLAGALAVILLLGTSVAFALVQRVIAATR